MVFSTLAVFASLALIIGLTVRDHQLLGNGGTLAAILMWMSAPIILTLRMKLGEDSSIEKSLWTSTGLNIWAILCSLGRPALLLDRLFMDDPNFPQQLALRSLVGQIVLMVGIIIFAAADTFHWTH